MAHNYDYAADAVEALFPFRVADRYDLHMVQVDVFLRDPLSRRQRLLELPIGDSVFLETFDFIVDRRFCVRRARCWWFWPTRCQPARKEASR